MCPVDRAIVVYTTFQLKRNHSDVKASPQFGYSLTTFGYRDHHANCQNPFSIETYTLFLTKPLLSVFPTVLPTIDL